MITQTSPAGPTPRPGCASARTMPPSSATTITAGTTFNRGYYLESPRLYVLRDRRGKPYAA